MINMIQSFPRERRSGEKTVGMSMMLGDPLGRSGLGKEMNKSCYSHLVTQFFLIRSLFKRGCYPEL